MLRILQTGDLHLGKIFYEYSLIEDQTVMLNSLIEELTAQHYDVLIICGDIYDRSVPPPEAVSLFDGFLNRMHSLFPDLPVCIISGNHDSAKRLGFGAELLRNANIHICTEAENCIKPVLLKNTEGSVEAALYQLPFLQSGSLTSSGEDVLRTQQDLVKEAVARIKNAHSKLQKSCEAYGDLPALLSCHVFTLGAQSGGSERIFIGNAEFVDASIFDFFAYTAAGHIHKMQKINDNLYYAGAPLAYSFDEAGKEKSFLKVEFTAENGGNISVSTLPVKSLRRVVKIAGNFEELLRSDKYVEYKNDYIECTYTDMLAAENAAVRLREKFPFLLSVKQQTIAVAQNERTASTEKKKQLFENENGLPLKDILHAFLADAGLSGTDEEEEKIGNGGINSGSEANGWDTAVDLFIRKFNEHETA